MVMNLLNIVHINMILMDRRVETPANFQDGQIEGQ